MANHDKVDNSDVMDLFVGPIPMHLNLGSDFKDPESVIGWARGYRKSDGTTHIAIQLDKEASEKLVDLAAVFELKAIGFAGFKRQPCKNTGGHGWTKPVSIPDPKNRPKGIPRRGEA